jgi:putative IMPACT (imprinted ancient) family translation regulator
VELVEAGLLIVRYFGGIKLGTGGLVRAYGSSAKEVIAHAKLIPFVFKERVLFSTIYSLVPRFEHYTSTQNVLVIKRDFQNDGVIWEIEVSAAEKEHFILFSQHFERDGFRLL